MAPGAPTIRPAVPADAAAIAGLSGELGYPVSPAAVARRLERLLPRPDQVVLVADAGGLLAGWIHGAEQELVEAERRCEILGLVIDQRRRREGTARRLVAAVEEWAVSRGLGEMSVRSNVTRAESHPFYEAIGYRRVKTQQVYRKRLPA